MQVTKEQRCNYTRINCTVRLLNQISNGQFGYHDNTKSVDVFTYNVKAILETLKTVGTTTISAQYSTK
jgi:hypothetical protein